MVLSWRTTGGCESAALSAWAREYVGNILNLFPDTPAIASDRLVAGGVDATSNNNAGYLCRYIPTPCSFLVSFAAHRTLLHGMKP